MNENTEMTTRGSTQAQESRDTNYSLRPPVNVFEDADGITLQADMPGVTKDRLRIQVDQDALSVEGDLLFDMPQGMDALYADVRATRYARSFALSSELDVDNIDASLKDGVLTLRVPKRAEVRPRKVEIRVG
jgi:HSP20 family molecular chaperone IbpA